MTALDRPAPLPRELAEPLEAAAARVHIAPIGSEVVYFPLATSTNDLALRLADHGCPDGTLVIAGQQTAGRGRGGHAWHSPAGSGLYVSVVVRSDAPEVEGAARRAHSGPDWPRWLTLTTGVALAEGLHAASGLPVSIKWPNDLVAAPTRRVRGARKLGGVLAEGRADAGILTHVIVGFGINVRRHAFPPEISAQATSLEDELGRDVDRGEVLAVLLQRLAAWLRRLRGHQTAEVASRWSQLAVGALGSNVEWVAEGCERRGVTAGIDADGALLIRAGTTIDRIVAGEVKWL